MLARRTRHHLSHGDQLTMTTRLSALTTGAPRNRNRKPRARTIILNERDASDFGAGIAHTEHGEQVSLIAWAKENEAKCPELRWLFAIPNGGLRSKSTAVKLRLEGVKPGVSDLFLPVPKGNHHGLWIEMKVGRNKPTTEQTTFQCDMRGAGYATATCWSFESARNIIALYLGGPLTEHVNKLPLEAYLAACAALEVH